MTSQGPIQIEGYFMWEGLDLNRGGNRGMICGKNTLSIKWSGQGQGNTGSQHWQE